MVELKKRMGAEAMKKEKATKIIAMIAVVCLAFLQTVPAGYAGRPSKGDDQVTRSGSPTVPTAAAAVAKKESEAVKKPVTTTDFLSNSSVLEKVTAKVKDSVDKPQVVEAAKEEVKEKVQEAIKESINKPQVVEAAKEEVKEKIQEAIKENIEESQLVEAAKEEVKEKIQEAIKENIVKPQVVEAVKEEVKEKIQEAIKENIEESQLAEAVKEEVKEKVQEAIKENIVKPQVVEAVKEEVKEQIQEAVKDGIHNSFLPEGLMNTNENVYTPGQVTAATYRLYDKNLEMVVNREALVYVPSSYDPSVPTPVVIALHGGTGTSEQMMNYTGLNEVAEAEGFIVVYPQGLGRTWNSILPSAPAAIYNVDDVGFIEYIIEDLDEQLNIASDQIYATGISNGGQMCYTLAAESDQIAAIAVIESGMGSPSDYQPSSPVPTMVIHGTADENIPYEGGTGNGLADDYSYMSATELAGYLIEVNQVQGASPTPYVPYEGFVESPEIEANILSSPNGADLVLITVNGGGHTWPGGTSNSYTDQQLGPTTQALDASQAVWSFFEGYPA